MDARTRTLVAALTLPIIGGVIALAATSTVGVPALELPLMLVVVAAVAIAAVRATSLVERDATPAIEPISPLALQRVAGDRRRPTFDRDTGLLADWYFRLRVEEEIARAQRYAQPFTLLRITHAADDTRGAIVVATRTCVRAIDLTGAIGSATCILLPNTTRAAAASVIERLLGVVPAAQIEAAECPADATTLGGLLGETEWTTHELRAEPEDAAA